MAATDGAVDADEHSFVEHPLVVDEALEQRRYQIDLYTSARNAHTLVCLPTGLGKTAVSLLVTADRLHQYADGETADSHAVDPADAKSLLLAPTKPLVEQHAASYRDALDVPEDEIVVFTGEVRPDDRAALWEDATVVVATPQVVENDLVGGRLSLESVVHCTFDECHRATGDYAYNYIADRYHETARDPLVTGMSASPGGDEEAIEQVCTNLGITDIAVKTEEDPDVEAYTHETSVEWERVQLPEAIEEVRDALEGVIEERLADLRELGVSNHSSADISQKDLNAIRARLQELVDNDQSEGYKGLSYHAELMKLRQAVTLAETQSVEALRRYFERQRNAARSSGASKASQRFASDPRVREAMRRAEDFDELHPKYERARALLAETLGVEGGDRAIVFTESRDTAEALTEFLNEDFDARRFVGQNDREGSDGMTQTQQGETLEEFRAGEFEVLVSTSVAEEGLDVPAVDLVLFYEPVPTAIRSIQRKGRTGRDSAGRVVVLMAEDTRDEAYFWIARRREREMQDELEALRDVAEELRAELDDDQESLAAFDGASAAGGEPSAGANASDRGGSDEEPAASETTADATATDGAGQAGLSSFDDAGAEETVDSATDEADDAAAVDTADADAADADTDDESEPDGVVAEPEDDTVEIVADQRELDADIARDLSEREEIDVRLETLAVGDYVCSDRVVVERKTVEDFLDTLLGGDRSLFEQVGDMARHYARPVVVIEGDELYEARNVHPNAIRGSLASVAVDFGASVLRTRDAADTRDLLATIASREQDEDDREVSVHGEKATKTLAEQQEYVVASIADIGPVTARSLLEHFGSVRDVMTAERDELLAAEGVGEVTADRIEEVVTSEYVGD
jgi:Fanconi anemia group M protein